MPCPSIPPELLGDIFSNLSSSTSDLYHVLLVSHTFADIVKPTLYRHITITNSQARLMLRVREEDKQLVKHVSIVGGGPFDIDEDEEYEEERYGVTEGSIRGLLSGRLLDISVIESLVVKDVREKPDSYIGYPDFKPAPKLSEISIRDHRGAGECWMTYLRSENVPALRRLGYVRVTSYELHENEDSEDENYVYYGGSRWFEDPVRLGEDVPYSQLEVLVAFTYSIPSPLPPLFPFKNFLALFPSGPTNRFPLVSLVRNCRCISSRYEAPLEFKAALASLRPEYSNDPPLSLQLFLAGRPKYILVEDYSELLLKLKSQGIEVHEDQDEEEHDSDSLIYPSFVNYLRKMGKINEN